jgi:DNA-binding phage protein
MNINEFVTPRAFRKFTEDMERTSKLLHETALRIAVPESSVLAQIAAQSLITQTQLYKMLEESVLLPQASLAAAVRATMPDIFNPRLWKEMENAAQRFREFLRACEKGAERLARSGWTLPISMTVEDLRDLINITGDDAIDGAFIAAYHEEGWLASLKDTLLNSARLKDWQLLVTQCLENYEKGNHVICIPALLSVLEGVVARPEGISFMRVEERIAYFRDKIDTAKPESLDRATWTSMNIFFELLYQKGDFAVAPPLKLNRNWILHGRDLPSSWRQQDALRLFHALATLCTLYDFEY